MDNTEKEIRLNYLGKVMYYEVHDRLSPLLDDMVDIRDNWDWTQGSGERLEADCKEFTNISIYVEKVWSEYKQLYIDLHGDPSNPTGP